MNLKEKTPNTENEHISRREVAKVLSKLSQWQNDTRASEMRFKHQPKLKTKKKKVS